MSDVDTRAIRLRADAVRTDCYGAVMGLRADALALCDEVDGARSEFFKLETSYRGLCKMLDARGDHCRALEAERDVERGNLVAAVALLRETEWEGQTETGKPACVFCHGSQPRHDDDDDDNSGHLLECEFRAFLEKLGVADA